MTPQDHPELHDAALTQLLDRITPPADLDAGLRRFRALRAARRRRDNLLAGAATIVLVAVLAIGLAVTRDHDPQDLFVAAPASTTTNPAGGPANATNTTTPLPTPTTQPLPPAPYIDDQACP